MTTLLPRQATDLPSEWKRGACPALSAPMITGDGLLARIALTEAVSPSVLAEICRMARRYGNGMLDISARGNLQVRGLTQATAPLLEADVRSLNLPLREGLAVEVPPLAGMDETEIADPCPLAEAIRAGARETAGLAPKMSVVVDGHGKVRLSHLLADIRLVAVATNEGVRWKILLGGTENAGRVFKVLRETQAVEATVDLLRTLAATGPRARGRDLAHDLPVNEAVVPSQASAFDLFPLSSDLHAVGIGPAFGQIEAEELLPLCKEATRLGVTSVKLAVDHSLLFFGPKDACNALAAFAAANGFITSAADRRAHIAACPGSPACASAAIPTHAIASQASTECGDLLDGSFKLHVTGCPKGCAHPQPSALALCGTRTGLSLIHQGKAADQPFAALALADTKAALRRLADLVRAERLAGENSAACLARLGAERLAAALTSERSH